MNLSEDCAIQVLKVKNLQINKELKSQVLKTLTDSYNRIYKAVAFDVDGTLTKRNSVEIDDEMSSIIGQLLKEGVHVLLISGRGRGSLREAAKQIIDKSQISSSYIRRLSGIAHNGIFWLKTNSPISSSVLMTEELIVEKPLTFLKDLRKEILSWNEYLEFFREGSIRITEEPTETPFLLRINYHRELYNRDPQKFKEFCGKLNQVIKSKSQNDDVFLTQAIYSGNYLLNIGNTNKTIALNYFAKKVGIDPNSILRVGDQGDDTGNDYELLNSPSGFSVGTISQEITNCLPVIDDKCEKQLLGVEATRELLKRVYLFPPLSLEPQHQPEQLRALQEFEELAARRSRNESKMFSEKLKLRLHRLLDNKDISFDHHTFELSDIFDIHSGAILVRSYEINKLDESSGFRMLFGLKDCIFYDNCPPNLKWSLMSDTNIILRGSNYYWAMTYSNLMEERGYFKKYNDEIIDFVLKAKNSLDSLLGESPSFIVYKFLIGIMDNVRNVLLNFMYASYLIECSSNISSYNNWNNSKKIYEYLQEHTKLFYDTLLEENLSWRTLVTDYSKFLKKLPTLLGKMTTYFSSQESSVEKKLLRKWRETDFFFENIVAINLGLHEFSEQLYEKKQKGKEKEIIGLGLVYGGSELPFIAEIIAKKKGIALKGAFLSISLYGNKKVRESALNSNTFKQIDDHKDALSSFFQYSGNSEFENKRIILLDDNCTTCRTFELTRDILATRRADIIGAIAVRFPSTNRYAQMLFPKHGFPDPDILLSFVRGFVTPSPYSRLFEKNDEGKEYLDKSDIFDKSKHRIIRYLCKNGNLVKD